jgi:hypothetical protein
MSLTPHLCCSSYNSATVNSAPSVASQNSLNGSVTNSNFQTGESGGRKCKAISAPKSEMGHPRWPRLRIDDSDLQISATLSQASVPLPIHDPLLGLLPRCWLPAALTVEYFLPVDEVQGFFPLGESSKTTIARVLSSLKTLRSAFFDSIPPIQTSLGGPKLFIFQVRENAISKVCSSRTHRCDLNLTSRK